MPRLNKWRSFSLKSVHRMCMSPIWIECLRFTSGPGYRLMFFNGISIDNCSLQLIAATGLDGYRIEPLSPQWLWICWSNETAGDIQLHFWSLALCWIGLGDLGGGRLWNRFLFVGLVFCLGNIAKLYCRIFKFTFENEKVPVLHIFRQFVIEFLAC